MMRTALIAEDEPLLALALQSELAQVWPALRIVATVGDGVSAVAQALALRPNVLFFDIRMPGLGGLEAAAELADAWPLDAPFPALVFVTAYDQYALQAFETHAVDYLLKPVQTARLRKTVEKIQRTFTSAEASPTPPDRTLEQLRQLLAATATASTTHATPLRVIQASVGAQIHLVPVPDILYFEAADKYLRVVTAEREYLIRTPLKELLPQLDPQEFWQIHRGTVVRATAIERVLRDEAGKLSLCLRGREERLGVSRVYGGVFRGM